MPYTLRSQLGEGGEGSRRPLRESQAISEPFNSPYRLTFFIPSPPLSPSGFQTNPPLIIHKELHYPSKSLVTSYEGKILNIKALLLTILIVVKLLVLNTSTVNGP